MLQLSQIHFIIFLNKSKDFKFFLKVDYSLLSFFIIQYFLNLIIQKFNF